MPISELSCGLVVPKALVNGAMANWTAYGKPSPFCAGFVTGTASQLAAVFNDQAVTSSGATPSANSRNGAENVAGLHASASSVLGVQPATHFAALAQSPATAGMTDPSDGSLQVTAGPRSPDQELKVESLSFGPIGGIGANFSVVDGDALERMAASMVKKEARSGL